MMSIDSGMIRPVEINEYSLVCEIINDSASAYKGVIPDICWHEPYMSFDELMLQISEGVRFSCFTYGSAIVGVMGIQDKGDVCLIRHAYVKSKARHEGIGTKLLKYLYSITEKPVLIGTWRDAAWAVSFYKKNNFRPVSDAEKRRLLNTYWRVSDIQSENSIVLADERWFKSSSAK